MDARLFIMMHGADEGSSPLPVHALPPLTIDGAYFREDGRLWRWVGLTAFLLWKLYLTGRQADARRYMAWAKGLGVNVLRVFSQVDWDGVPVSAGGKGGVAPGFLARDFPNYDDVGHLMIAEAGERGLRVELVAHTFRDDLDVMLEHSRRVDGIAVAHTNALFEDANEPPVNRIPIEALVAGFTPRTLASSGQYDPTPYPARRWLNDHPPRDDEFARKFKGGQEYAEGSGPYAPFTPPWRGPVVLDEPKRVDEGGTPDEWKSFGAGCAFFCAGGTIHGGAWAQTCTVPTDPATLGRIDAFLRGMASVPVQRYSGYEHPNNAGSLRRYRRRGDDGITYEVSVSPFDFRAI